MKNQETVLVTGGSGFIATHCIIKLLAEGYRVKATVRDLSRTDELENILQKANQRFVNDSSDEIEWVLANLSSDEGWDDAVTGCEYVLHIASPITTSVDVSDNEMIIPARDGTIRVMKAASKAGVKRVVLTSSVSAILGGTNKKEAYDEGDWTDVNASGVSAYAKSKTIAERAAWDFVDNDPSGLELTSVNPSVVFGPVLEQDYGTSVALIASLLNGEIPIAFDIGLGVVDVRDVADMNLLAMTKPEAAGERFICSESSLRMIEIAHILKKHLPKFSSRLPSRVAPNVLVKFAALFNSRLKSIAPDLGRRRMIKNTKAKELLGWSTRPAKEAIESAADSLLWYDIVG